MEKCYEESGREEVKRGRGGNRKGERKERRERETINIIINNVNLKHFVKI